MSPEALAELRLVTHPTRVDILTDLDNGAEISPKAFATVHGDEVERVAYHFRVLRQRGLIRLKRSKPVRGTVERFYVRTSQGDVAIGRLRALLRTA